MADAKVRDVYKIGKTLGTGGELLVQAVQFRLAAAEIEAVSTGGILCKQVPSDTTSQIHSIHAFG